MFDAHEFYATVPPRPPVSLPQALGPKLPPFTPTAEAEIEFIEELGDPENDQDGRVWKVRINGSSSCFALKMVIHSLRRGSSR